MRVHHELSTSLVSRQNHLQKKPNPSELNFTQPLDQRKLQREIWIRKQPSTRFGLCICRLEGEMYVTDVRENSIAWNAGINISDRIVSIDDIQLTPHHFDAQTVLDLLYQAGPSLVLRVVDQPRFCRVEIKKSTPNSALGLVYLPGATNEHPGKVTSAYLGCAAEQIANANLSIVSVDGEDTISMPDRDMMEKVCKQFDQNARVELSLMPMNLVRSILLTRKTQERNMGKNRSSVRGNAT